MTVKPSLAYESGAACTSEGCNRPARKMRVFRDPNRRKIPVLCGRCYQRWWATHPDRPDCRIDDCQDKAGGGGLCSGHRHRLRRYGDPLAGQGRGTPGKPRGLRRMEGRYVTAQGYVRVRTEGVGQERWVSEHRLVMEQHLGRKLLPEETVHHKDLNKLNNALSNLELWTGSHPTGQRVSDVLAWCREMLARYGDLEMP